ncbi:MAG: STAS domain-containing protein [Nevskiaceae bacterium]
MSQHRTSTKAGSRKRGSGRRAAPLRLEGMAFTLPADLGIEHAATLHSTLSPLLATTAPVELVASDVSRVHTASLQVLAAFVRERTSAGGPTTWRAPSALLRESAIRAALDTTLGLSAVSAN